MPIQLLFCALLSLAAASGHGLAADATVDIDMTLRLDPAARTIEGEAQLRLPDGRSRRLQLAAAAQLRALSIDDQPARRRQRVRGALRSWSLPARAQVVDVRWGQTLEPTPTHLDHRATIGRADATAAALGSFLPAAAHWYPSVQVDGEPTMQRWRVTVITPPGQRAIVPGRLVEEADDDAGRTITYRMDVPAEGIDLIAGPYRVAERRIDSIDGRALSLRTLFHPEIEASADDYLDSLAGYFERYEKWIGPYPFDDFTIVSSPTPTGLGLPSLTYLGINVLKLPFIRDTSLGHEVLHNWWGNGVYPDYEGGNWSEGLTTFMADYHYAESNSTDKARLMRLGWLRDLSAIPPGKGLALARFTSRKHGVAAAVGYGKSAMLFYMLRERIGQANFDKGIRRFWRTNRFKVAGWPALREAFEATSGQSLEAFFAQWVEREGLPRLRLVRNETGGAELQQDESGYQLTVPLEWHEDSARQILIETLSGPSHVVAPPPGGGRLLLDPDFRLLRRLAADEIPPTLRDVNLAGSAQLTVLGDGILAGAAEELAHRLLDAPASPVDSGQPADDLPLLVVGPPDAVDGWLAHHGAAPRPQEVGKSGDVQAWAGRHGNGQPLLVVSAASANAAQAAARALPHLGRYGWVVFEDGRSSDRGHWPSTPQSITLPGSIPAAD
ncbi:MAG: M1 family peptidase [Rhodocyclaceae bacterium]|nr:M1 family peptidase [Rhodocyclaceae bacterium]